MNYTVTQAQIDKLNATLSFALEQVAAITGQPVQPPVEPPKPVDPPVQPQEGVYPLGPMSPQGGPMENGMPGMIPGMIYVRSQSIASHSGTMQFLSGYMSGYDLPNFTSWVSGAPGAAALPFPGCEAQELMGANVSQHVINLDQIKASGVQELWFCVRADGPTGRYMERRP